MKKILTLLYPFLKGIRLYRKTLGGTWYRVRDTEELSGFASTVTFWTNDEKDVRDDAKLEIIKSETFGRDSVLTISVEIQRRNTIMLQGYIKISRQLMIGPDNPEIRAIVAETMKQLSELNTPPSHA